MNRLPTIEEQTLHRTDHLGNEQQTGLATGSRSSCY